jgi:cytochrome c553
MGFALIVAVLPLVAVCPSLNPSPPVMARQTAAPEPTPTPSPLEDARRSVTAHMPTHLERSHAIRIAVMSGRLDDAHTEARWIAEHWPAKVLEEWLPFVVNLRAAAGEIVEAEDVHAASRGTGAVALACGECHDALREGPRYELPPPPPDDPDAAAIMRRHQWAADRLWDGVVLPNDEAWSLGAGAIVELPRCDADVGGEKQTQVIADAVRRTNELATEAASATDLDARARIYGELLGTCHTCHLAGC